MTRCSERTHFARVTASLKQALPELERPELLMRSDVFRKVHAKALEAMIQKASDNLDARRKAALAAAGRAFKAALDLTKGLGS